nr:MAG TPA: hypothetical protein [Ackermannviridae sp.]
MFKRLTSQINRFMYPFMYVYRILYIDNNHSSVKYLLNYQFY